MLDQSTLEGLRLIALRCAAAQCQDADGPRQRTTPRTTHLGGPTSGGLGALPFAQHLVAREAKWALRLLIDGTSKPWSKLA